MSSEKKNKTDNLTRAGEKNPNRKKEYYIVSHPQTVEKLMTAISNGYSYEACCSFAGISETAFYDWKQKGKIAYAEEERRIDDGEEIIPEERNPFAIFYGDLMQKIAISEITLVNDLKERGVDDWRSRAWMLERRFPERWAQTQNLNVEKRKKKELTPEEIQKRIERYEKFLRGETD